ncbi:hypothetical protein QBC38DRAFT_478073 [Podospora fimiseda]|uniref:Uncharacterized protein n=1 Tax=Podospora fimiseda TaxID=252190 RepID=A0AAN7H2I6_9PEZI|nr:hypothetical protein QBC38DRAFT_478073 [Podospora fimiseda]
MAAPLGKYLTKLAGKRILIIGGSSGIGFGVADAAVQHGASSVIISSSSTSKIEHALERLRPSITPGSNTQLQGLGCNLGSQDTLTSEVEKLFTLAAKDGKLDHVVFTASDAPALGPIEKFSLEEIVKAGNIRFFAPLLVGQQLKKHLNNTTGSSYTITTGGASEHVGTLWTVMQSYLMGLRGMTRGLAADLAPIRVNAVALGPVDTELWAQAKESGYFAVAAERFKKRMVTGKVGEVEDVVEAYLYSMKDKNASGSIIETHGGTQLS